MKGVVQRRQVHLCCPVPPLASVLILQGELLYLPLSPLDPMYLQEGLHRNIGPRDHRALQVTVQLHLVALGSQMAQRLQMWGDLKPTGG